MSIKVRSKKDLSAFHIRTQIEDEEWVANATKRSSGIKNLNVRLSPSFGGQSSGTGSQALTTLQGASQRPGELHGIVVSTLLQVVPQLSEQDCMAVMLEAHNTGVGLVIVCDIEPAEFYCETLKGKGLTSSIEPES